MPTSDAAEAHVVRVRLDAAHDSEALAIVVLRFANGAESQLQLDGDAVAHLLRTLEIASIEALVGQPFSAIAPALPANRASTR